MISKLHMKYRSTGQREVGLQILLMFCWITESKLKQILNMCIYHNKKWNSKEGKLASFVMKTGKASFIKIPLKKLSLCTFYRWSAGIWIFLWIHGYSLKLPEIFPVQLWSCTEVIILFFLCSVILGQLLGLTISLIFSNEIPILK